MESKQPAYMVPQISKEDTVLETVLSSHSKIDKTKILLTNGSLMTVKSIAKLSSKGSILQYF